MPWGRKERNDRMKKALWAALGCAALLATAGCSKMEPVSTSGFALDTAITITVYQEDQLELANQAMELCQQYDDMFSKTKEQSDVYRINHAQGQKVEVGEEVANMLSRSLEYSRLSDGAFDITIQSVNALWDFKAENPTLPAKEDIEKALQSVGYEQISLTQEGDQWYCQVPDGVQIDLGGIAKGYIADQMANFLKEKGVENAVIDLGGNVKLLGDKNGEGYTIGVRSPFDETGQSLLGTVEASDCEIVTSGDYERYITVDGVKYHHILDTKTGYSVENDLTAVTILSDDGLEADALSTTCFALGKEKGMELIEKLEGTECIMVLKDGTILQSSGASNYHFEEIEN